MEGLIIHTAEQGTPEWLQARKGVITGSRFKDCRDRLKSGAPSKKCLDYAMDVAREREGGEPMQVFVNGAMRLGTEQEPYARAVYERKTGHIVDEAGFITTPDRLFGVSVDGLVGDDGIIEIKTMVSSDTLFTAFVVPLIAAYDGLIGPGAGAFYMIGFVMLAGYGVLKATARRADLDELAHLLRQDGDDRDGVDAHGDGVAQQAQP